MKNLYYIGLDVHKKFIQYCIKLIDGQIVREGRVGVTRAARADGVSGLDRPWKGALEATMFSAWIYDARKPHAVAVKVAHSAMRKAIATSKHASDRLDARQIADLVRMDWIPGVWMAPPELCARRLQLRSRNLVVRQATQTNNRIAATLIEHGVEYSSSKLHGKRYFRQLLDRLDEVPEAVRSLLRHSRGNLDLFETPQRTLRRGLRTNPTLAERVRLLETIPGVLIEAAHRAPRYHPALRQLSDKVEREVHAGAAAVNVARKLGAYLMAVDKSRQPFQLRTPPAPSPGHHAPSAPRSSPSRVRSVAAASVPVP